NLDFNRFHTLLPGIGAFVHGGHDEYWDGEERHQVDAALAAGKTSLAYFGANGGYWRVRTGPSRAGQPLRTLICYKDTPDSDPQPGSTVRYRDGAFTLPENALFGAMYDGWQLMAFPLIVRDPS